MSEIFSRSNSTQSKDMELKRQLSFSLQRCWVSAWGRENEFILNKVCPYNCPKYQLSRQKYFGEAIKKTFLALFKKLIFSHSCFLQMIKMETLVTFLIHVLLCSWRVCMQPAPPRKQHYKKRHRGFPSQSPVNQRGWHWHQQGPGRRPHRVHHKVISPEWVRNWGKQHMFHPHLQLRQQTLNRSIQSTILMLRGLEAKNRIHPNKLLTSFI